jgi:hypothetical protein
VLAGEGMKLKSRKERKRDSFVSTDNETIPKYFQTPIAAYVLYRIDVGKSECLSYNP